MAKKTDILTLELSIHELKARIDNEVDKRLTKLEKDTHPPIFTEETIDKIYARLEVFEAWLTNIKLITTNHKEID